MKFLILMVLAFNVFAAKNEICPSRKRINEDTEVCAVANAADLIGGRLTYTTNEFPFVKADVVKLGIVTNKAKSYDSFSFAISQGNKYLGYGTLTDYYTEYGQMMTVTLHYNLKGELAVIIAYED